MRSGFRTIRVVVGSAVLLAVILGGVGYAIYAVNGILNVVETQAARDDNYATMQFTATALSDRLTALAGPDVGGDADGDAGRDAEGASPEESGTTSVTPVFSDGTPSPVSVRPKSNAMLRAGSLQQATVMITPIPTNTPRSTLGPTVAMPTTIPTNTPRVVATATATPSATATPLPPTFTPEVSPTYIIEGTYAVPIQPPVAPIPERAPFIDTDPDVVNFLLLGSDTTGGGVGHTDVIILVSVNKRAESVAMWHIPRDLFVYIPNYTMDRINLAYAFGEGNDYPGGGFGLMRETIKYNFGIDVDHYARVDFDDFMRIVDELGGLDVSIDCAIADWRLISPELDPLVEENWEYYTLPIGRQRLAPYMALWYVRSRKTTSDLDRGRRQMDALRAMWHQARAQGLFAQVTQLWPEAVEVVETDMTLTDVLSFVPLAISLDMSNIARYSGTIGDHYIPFKTPDDGREVFLPDRSRVLQLIDDFLTPPTGNRLGRKLVTVDVVDKSAYGIGFDLVAADRLAWEGFAARPVPPGNYEPLELTVIYDFTGQVKGSALEDLKRVLRVSDSQVVVQPDPNRMVDYRVEIGGAYNSCVYGNAEDEVNAGPPIPTETPASETGDTGSDDNNVG